MAMRRPRIKASANLMGAKRKPKLPSNSSSPPTADNDSVSAPQSTENEVTQEDVTLDVPAEKKTQVENIVAAKSRREVNLKSAKQTPMKNDKQNTAKTDDGDKTINENNKQQLATDADRQPLLNPKLEYMEAKAPEEGSNNAKDNAVAEKVTDKSFKFPPNVVGFNRSNSNTASSGLAIASVTGGDDIFHSDVEDVNVIQMDMQKSSNNINYPLSPMSPSKTIVRQRIRATPIFGQRRNSFVGTSPSPHTGDEADFTAPITHRRERHYSASLSQTSNASSTHANHYTPQKYVPLMHTGRIRTESGCSAFSDSYAASSKSRKGDDHHHRSLSRRDFEARFSKGVVPDKSMLKMFDLIYYNPVTNPMEQKNLLNMKQEATQADETKTTEDVKPTQSNNDKNTTDSPASVPVPQLKLNSNGELILDDKSLVIETTAEKEARKALASSTLLYLDENTGMNGFYRKQKRTKEWQAEETIKFYRCLQTIGTDFSLMSELFPKRTRRDLKLKFKKEERCNLALINKALLHPKIFNIDELKVQLEAEERERAEAEKKWKELKAREAQNFKKTKAKNYAKSSAGARALADGDAIYENENITKEKLKKRVSKKNTKTTKKPSKTAPAPNENPSTAISTQEVTQLPAVDAIVPVKKKRCRAPRKPNKNQSTQNKQTKTTNLQKNQIKIGNICIISSSDDIVHENIKKENHHLQITDVAHVEYESNQLEMELDELLHNNQPVEEILSDNYNSNHYIINTPFDVAHKEEGIECKSLVNMDSGTVMIVNDEEMDASRYNLVIDDYAIPLQEQQQQEQQFEMEPEIENDDELEQVVEEEDLEESPKYNSSDMEESDIQQILMELSEGSMVLVSTLDPNNADKLLNEIYMLDKVTGELCDKPLDIPDAIVQCILSVMS